MARDVLAGIAATEERERSGIFSTTAGTLAAYRSERALALADGANFDPWQFPHGGDTIYVCAPARYQALIAPVLVAFLEQVRGRHLSSLRRRHPAPARHAGARRGGQYRPPPRPAGHSQ